MELENFRVSPGEEVRFSKTIGESDVYLFAGLTGDLSEVHCNHEYMSKGAFGQRIAHGVLTVGLMSTTSTLMYTPHVRHYVGYTPVSQGYDRIRFAGPVFFGDTITVTYRVKELEPERNRALADVEARNQRGDLVASAIHIMRWVEVHPVDASA
jgi:3-hydroxybutyryl-CoA dehydratase